MGSGFMGSGFVGFVEFVGHRKARKSNRQSNKVTLNGEP